MNYIYVVFKNDLALEAYTTREGAQKAVNDLQRDDHSRNRYWFERIAVIY